MLLNLRKVPILTRMTSQVFMTSAPSSLIWEQASTLVTTCATLRERTENGNTLMMPRLRKLWSLPLAKDISTSSERENESLFKIIIMSNFELLRRIIIASHLFKHAQIGFSSNLILGHPLQITKQLPPNNSKLFLK
jgi:hypothetical protein